MMQIKTEKTLAVTRVHQTHIPQKLETETV